MSPVAKQRTDYRREIQAPGKEDIPTNAAEMLSAEGMERRGQNEEEPEEVENWIWGMVDCGGGDGGNPGGSHILLKQPKRTEFLKFKKSP